MLLSGMLTIAGYAQANKYTLSGYVKDKNTGEELIGAQIIIKELSGTGASTNAYGFYSITLPEAEYTAEIKYMGYAIQSVKVNLSQNLRMDFELEDSHTELQEVVITATRRDENITSVQMGVDKIDLKEIENIPLLMGERDVLKIIQMRPGVKPAGEGNSGFYVRGGGADQNLILLDEATVYNASHLLGFFSVFNSDAIKDISLYKGSQPAEYGGRLASVLDIRMEEGSNQDLGVEGGIGLISSRLKIDGPIVKNKGSFSISGRRTYADLFLRLSSDEDINDAQLYFYDLNLKANYRINDRNRIFVSGYLGQDVLGLDDLFRFDWGNSTATLRWNHLFSERLFSNTSFIFSDFNYNIGFDFSSTSAEIVSRIQDYNVKQDFQYYANTKNTLKFGFNSIYHRVVPGVFQIVRDGVPNRQDMPNVQGWENAVYISNEWKPSNRLSLQYGIRFSAFSVLGPGDFYSYDNSGNAIDTLSYSSGEFVKTYFNPEPRLAANYILNEKSSLKLSYGRNTQNLHLLSNSTTSNPTDLWITNSLNVKPQIADQVSAGYFRNFNNNMYEFSTEVYYKYMQNQIDYRDGAQLAFNQNVEAQLLYGVGRAYGIELFLKKSHGRINGWIGYTLSRTERKIDGINQGNWYTAKQDRTHDISIVANYELSRKWTLSANWIYYTGNAITFPSGKYEVGGNVVNYYTERNGYRMPAYHRLDIGATWITKKTEKFESSWNFSIYNAYGRENAYVINFRQDPDDASRTQAVQTSLFRWIPSVTYNFKF
ncbi:MAG: collagen-binding protein [Bacteroidia bacterium 44-10]|nr:MAG: collagen-binding protein [Bacteroidia bacterium 44-10]